MPVLKFLLEQPGEKVLCREGNYRAGTVRGEYVPGVKCPTLSAANIDCVSNSEPFDVC